MNELYDPAPKLFVPSRFHIPGKRKFVEGQVDLKTNISAKYNVQVLRMSRGGVIEKPFGDTWFPNVITNKAFDLMMGSGFGFISGFFTYATAGTGATAPAVTDTSLTALWTGGGGSGYVSTKTGSGASTVNDTVGGTCTHTNSFDFAAAASGVTLNEVGMYTSNSAGNLATHALFPSAVTLNTGDVLRLSYALTYSVPSTVTAIPVSLSAINGFNISGNIKVIGPFQYIFGLLNTNGTTATGDNAPTLINAQASSNIWLLSAPTTFPAVNTFLSTTQLGSAVTASLGTYTNGSFTRNATHTWVPSNPATTVSNVIGILTNNFGLNSGMYLLLSAAQTKANTNTLTVVTSATLARG
jgi:hypothetical protein